MRTIVFCCLIGLVAPMAGAQTIPYDQISAKALGYCHVDIARLFASRISQLDTGGGSLRKMTDWGTPSAFFLTTAKSCTLYVMGKQGRPVLLFRGSAQSFRQEMEQPRSKNLVVFEYGHHEVHFSSACLLPEMFGNGKTASTDEEQRNQLSFGLGGEDTRFNGSFYTAYVGQDLVILTLDLPSMATALDVLDGKKPSLATQDPHGLKFAAPPGTLFMGAGMSAQWETEFPKGEGGTTPPPGDSGEGNLRFDLLGSLKGRAKLARFDFGEDATNDYLDTSITMSDADSASQLAHVVMGIKALAMMSQAQAVPFLNPLTIQSQGNEALLHWAMPTEKLFELAKQLSEASGGEQHRTSPTTQAAH